MPHTLKPRNLRILLINDESELCLPADLIETVTCEQPYGPPLPMLSTWEQHLFMWGSGDEPIPQFDLLLIDIRFGFDETDPLYFGELEAIEQGDNIPPIPYGLLHALPLVARQDLTHMPFVWGIHSGDALSVANDPIAQFAFGLLTAMSREEGWNKWQNPKQIPSHFSAQITDLPSHTASSAWRSLIEQYRRRLCRSCEEKLMLDLAEIEHLIDLASKNDLTDMAEAGLNLKYGTSQECLRIRSLFADYESFDEAKEYLLDYLRGLKEIAEEVWQPVFKIEQIAQIVENAKNGLYEDGKAHLDDDLPKYNKPLEVIAVILCLWIDHWYHATPKRSREQSDILAQLGYNFSGKGNYHFANRNLQKYFRVQKLSLGDFLARLEKSALLLNAPALEDTALLDFGQRYWHHLKNKYPDEKGHTRNPPKFLR